MNTILGSEATGAQPGVCGADTPCATSDASHFSTSREPGRRAGCVLVPAQEVDQSAASPSSALSSRSSSLLPRRGRLIVSTGSPTCSSAMKPSASRRTAGSSVTPPVRALGARPCTCGGSPTSSLTGRSRRRTVRGRIASPAASRGTTRLLCRRPAITVSGRSTTSLTRGSIGAGSPTSPRSRGRAGRLTFSTRSRCSYVCQIEARIGLRGGAGATRADRGGRPW